MLGVLLTIGMNYINMFVCFYDIYIVEVKNNND